METRSFDGRGNNLIHPEWGSVGQQLLRKTQVDYGDGIASMAGASRPSPRVISNVVCRGQSVENGQSLSDFVWAWGQFLDHELDLSEPVGPERADMTAPYNDPAFPNGQISFERTIYDPTTGSGGTYNPRQQINQITTYIDASNVYGSSEARAKALRTFSKGKLKTNDQHPGLLPFNTLGLPNARDTSARFFVAGDIRANEHAVLMAMHTLWVSEHNRLCDIIAHQNPGWDDEQIYQRARRLVGATMQVITYYEFLPALLGPGALNAYDASGQDEDKDSYSPHTNPGISNLFSTACYRLGHSMLSETINVIVKGASVPLALRDAFFNPQILIDNGVVPFLQALYTQKMREVDTKIVESVRSFLFAPPGTPVPQAGAQFLDLAALNIQRGRDHGLADYNQCRRDWGLTPKTSFAEISLDPAVQQALQAVYGSVDNIDVWVGALAEDKYGFVNSDSNQFVQSNVGELIFTVLKDQFERLRNGDRFWFEIDPEFTAEKVAWFKERRLSHVIRDNYPEIASHVPEDVFRAIQHTPIISHAAQNGTGKQTAKQKQPVAK